MIRRTITVGLIGGFILTLAGVYPLVGLFAPSVIPGWQAPISYELLNTLFLMASAAIGIPVFIFGGAWAARRGPAIGWQQGLQLGLLAGATAGSGCYITLISPMNALVAYGQITPHLSSLVVASPLPEGTLVTYVAAFDNIAYSFELTLALFALVWGVSGALSGWRRRSQIKPEKPMLYSLVGAGINPRKWFADDESTIVVGLLVGVGIGLLSLITTSGWFYAGFAQGLPEFRKIVQSSHIGMVTGPITVALAALSPLLVIALLGFGVFIVALVKNPRDRFKARTTAVLLAAVIIAVFISSIGLRFFYFNMGLAPFLLSQEIRENPDDVMQILIQLRRILNTFAVPVILVSTTFLLAWSLLLIAIVVGLLYGGLQAAVSVGLVPQILKRPVDRAASVQKQIKREPSSVLLILYALSAAKTDLLNILAHLSIRTFRSMPSVSHLSAAFHTLGDSSKRADHIQAVDATQSILSENPQWRWSVDFTVFYRAIYEILTARTMEKILVIRMPKQQQTVSLPSDMVQSLQHINRIGSELQKSGKVEDLATKLIFLENALAEIRNAQRFVNNSFDRKNEAAGSLPQHVALLDALDHLQDVVLTATKRLKGRADLVSSLQNPVCDHSVPLPLIWQVKNRGLNVAQEVRLRVIPGQDYITDEGQAEIDILSPGDEQQITLSIIPLEDSRRLRVEWEILYDDAVVDDRRLTFADVVEFLEPEHTFQRVFPIPYVTGTPLKSDDVFVGREDVFAFIQENLIGRHQNNVIILHGQRRTGKTSVMYRLGRMMMDTHISVLIDMQGKPARNEADFLYSIADDIVFALEDLDVIVDLPTRADFADMPEFYFRSRFLRSLYPKLGGRNLLLMFDEFEELQRRVENGRLQPEIFQFLRNLMQHEEKVDFVFSGTHRLEDLSADYWSILFNIAAYKPIGFLDQAEVRRLITEPVAQYDIVYDPLAVDRIMQVTAGHPYFTQLILHEMMVYHNETQRSYLTTADVEKVLERILERGEAHFKHIWAESSSEERDVLAGLTELTHSSDSVALHDLQIFLQERGRQSADSWRSEIDSLVGREILTQVDVRSTRHRFKVDLIRLWIERSRPPL